MLQKSQQIPALRLVVWLHVLSGTVVGIPTSMTDSLWIEIPLNVQHYSLQGCLTIDIMHGTGLETNHVC